jgi:putative addiction module antidote
MVTLKLSKIGNSVGVVFPKEMLSKMHAKEGDKLFFIETSDGYTLTPYDVTFAKQMKLAKEIMQKNKDVLKVLAE